MTLLKKYKTILIFVGVVVALYVGYAIFFAGSSDPALTSQVVAPQEVGSDLLNTLLTLRALSLDDAVFASPSFQSLLDFSKPIPPLPIGRTNPFAPLGQ